MTLVQKYVDEVLTHWIVDCDCDCNCNCGLLMNNFKRFWNYYEIFCLFKIKGHIFYPVSSIIVIFATDLHSLKCMF